MIDKLLAAFNGKKTYIIGLLVVLVAGLESLGYLTHDQAELFYGLLGGTGLVALRHGIEKTEPKKK